MNSYNINNDALINRKRMIRNKFFFENIKLLEIKLLFPLLNVKKIIIFIVYLSVKIN